MKFLRWRGSGVRGWARFFRFLTFYPFADKNLIVSSYFIVEKKGFFFNFFEGIYKKKGLGLLEA